MFEWTRKKKIEGIASRVREFVDANFEDPSVSNSKESSIRYSINPDIMFSVNTDVSESTIKKEEKDDELQPLLFKALDDYRKTGSFDRAMNILNERVNLSFVDMMLMYIREKDLKDSTVYKAAQIDRRLFSKIVSDREYKPAKDTCVALCYGMRLTLQEAKDMLSRAGYSLSHSSKRDLILEYFFDKHQYDLNDINDVLDGMDQKILGR